MRGRDGPWQWEEKKERERDRQQTMRRVCGAQKQKLRYIIKLSIAQGCIKISFFMPLCWWWMHTRDCGSFRRAPRDSRSLPRFPQKAPSALAYYTSRVASQQTTMLPSCPHLRLLLTKLWVSMRALVYSLTLLSKWGTSESTRTLMCVCCREKRERDARFCPTRRQVKSGFFTQSHRRAAFAQQAYTSAGLHFGWAVRAQRHTPPNNGFAHF